MNLDAAAERLEREHGPLDLHPASSPAATTSPPPSASELVDHWIYVIDTAAGDDIPRKGGSACCRPTCSS